MKKTMSGFTIVELLIVIVVIAILAAISVVAYSGVQQRAKAASVVSTLKATEKAFRLLAAEQGRTTWWIDSELTGTGNPTIAQIISSSNLQNYLQNVSVPDGIDLRYDNDGDTYNGCSLSVTGVKLFAYGVSSSLVQSIDSQIDDGNLSCGRVTWSLSDSSAFSYYLSNSQQM